MRFFLSIVFLAFLIPALARADLPVCNKTEWRTCQYDSQCTIVLDACGQAGEAVNLEFKADLQHCNTEQAKIINCQPSSALVPPAGAACVDGMCKAVGP